MENELYQRPREKIRSIGAEGLSMLELLQSIIGSGNSQASAATIARLVEPMLHTQSATYDQLCLLRGVGNAKACQLLAVQEILRRRELWKRQS